MQHTALHAADMQSFTRYCRGTCNSHKTQPTRQQMWNEGQMTTSEHA